MLFETKTAVISKYNDDIIRLLFKDNDLDIDLEEVKMQIEAAEKIANDKKMLILVDARKSMHYLTKEAKEYVARFPLKKAEAILVKELHQRLVATFYLKAVKATGDQPIKVFTKEEAAIKWLMTFK